MVPVALEAANGPAADISKVLPKVVARPSASIKLSKNITLGSLILLSPFGVLNVVGICN